MTKILTVNEAIERAHQLDGCLEDVNVMGYFIYAFERVALFHHIKSEWKPEPVHYPPFLFYETEFQLEGSAIWLNVHSGYIKDKELEALKVKSGSTVLVRGRLKGMTLIGNKPTAGWRWLRKWLIPYELQGKYAGLGHMGAYQAELIAEKFL
jgi:hypothetical protein